MRKLRQSPMIAPRIVAPVDARSLAQGRGSLVQVTTEGGTEQHRRYCAIDDEATAVVVDVVFGVSLNSAEDSCSPAAISRDYTSPGACPRVF